MMNINFNSVLNTVVAKAKALALNVTEIEVKPYAGWIDQTQLCSTQKHVVVLLPSCS